MAAFELDPLTDPRWAALVARRPDATVFHTPAWLDALRRTYDYEPTAYAVASSDTELDAGIAACRIRSCLTGRRIVSVPFADHCEPLVGSAPACEAILASMRRAVDEDGWKYLELRPLNVEWPGADTIAPSDAYWIHRLDLTPSLDDLFNGFHKDSIQRKIRRAEREMLRCETGTSDDHLQAFYRLLVATRRRHGLPPQPVNWFRNLVACLGNRVSIAVASKGGKAVAAVLTLRHDATLVYKYGASDASVHSLGAMPFLFWSMIRGAKEAGLRQLDLGRTDMGNEGLATFKDRLGAGRARLTYRRYPTAASIAKPPRVLPKLLLDRLPDRLLMAAGRLLYRHVG